MGIRGKGESGVSVYNLGEEVLVNTGCPRLEYSSSM